MELMCGWKDGAHIVSELAEKLGGHSQVPWLMRKEFPRKCHTRDPRQSSQGLPARLS